MQKVSRENTNANTWMILKTGIAFTITYAIRDSIKPDITMYTLSEIRQM